MGDRERISANVLPGRLSVELAPYLPALSQYALLLSGSQEAAAEILLAMTESLTEAPERLAKTSDSKFDLFCAFQMEVAGATSTWSRVRPDFRRVGIRAEIAEEYGRTSTMERAALLLTSLEGFSVVDTATILQVPPAKVRELRLSAIAALRSLQRGQTIVLASRVDRHERIRAAVHDFGQSILAPQVLASLTHLPENVNLLIIDDDELLEYAQDLIINTQHSVSVVLINGSQNEKFRGNISGNILKLSRPYTSQKLRTAIAQILLLGSRDDPHYENYDPKNMDSNSSFTKSLAEHLEPRPGPIDALVVGGMLKLAPTHPPESRLSLSALNELRLDNLKDVRRVQALCSNAPSFGDRLTTLGSLLDQDLSEESALRIGNQTVALQSMSEALDEVLSGPSAADVKSVVEALSMFSRQFPIWRQFAEEASTRLPLGQEALLALRAVSAAIAAQPSDVVDPRLAQAIAETEAAAEISAGTVSQFSFVRAISNLIKAIGRYLVARAKGAGAEFTKDIDKRIGQGLASGLVAILVGVSTPLLVLAAQIPQEFGWVGPMLAVLRVALIGKR